MSTRIWQGLLTATLLTGALGTEAKQEDMTADRWQGTMPIAPPPSRTPLVPAGGPLLWDNGSVITHPGGGPGGADASLIHGNVFGYNHQVPVDFAVADDFQIQGGSWQVDTIQVYGYQTNSGTTPSINDVRMQIWDGPPNDPGSLVVWGDLTTNVLYSALFSGIYRVAGLPGDTARPLMALTVNVNTVLPEGQYWIEWQAGGNPNLAGPWSPPIAGGPAGNALQRSPVWHTLPSGGGSPPGSFDELPFLVFGSQLGGFDCGTLVQVVGVWDDTTGTCGDMTSNAVSARYESTLLNVPPPQGNGFYRYSVDFVQNRVQERTAATTLMVHGSPYPLRGAAQWWDRMLAFNISGDGKYSIYRYNGTARPVVVQKWTPIIGAVVAPPPASNNLEVELSGGQLTFLLNGVALRTIPTAFTIDQFGIGFVRSRSTTGNLLTDDWLEVEDASVQSALGAPRSAVPPVSAAQAAANARANLQPGDGNPMYSPATTKGGL